MVDYPPSKVPQRNWDNAPIEQVLVHKSKKTLGIWTSPSGNYFGKLQARKEKLQVWTYCLSVGRLPAKWAWVGKLLLATVGWAAITLHDVVKLFTSGRPAWL